MEDDKIISLYWQRKESAIQETEKKYNRYLMKIAYNILCNQEDSKESVNDTYFRAWNCIPPHKPFMLSTFLGIITRQISIDILRKHHSKKRSGSEYILSLSELNECIPCNFTPEQALEQKLLSHAIHAYLITLPEETRNIFLCRYFFLDSIHTIASYYNATESKIKSKLSRTRAGLKTYLEQEGFFL